jgi:tagatose 1,6-diphosphate aldolase
MTLSAGKLWGMRRLADTGGRYRMLAVDQRPPIKNVICERLGIEEAPYSEVAAFKAMLVRELQAEASATLQDPHYAYPKSVHVTDPRLGLILTLEDSQFRETPGGRLSSVIDDWSVEKIKRAGGDAVKVLAWYRPDADPAVVDAQKEFTRRIGEACARFDIPFLFELLVYPLPRDADETKDYVEMKGKNADHVLQSVADFAAPEFGIDIFKLESPVAAADVPGVGNEGADEVQALFDEMGRLANRPWVMLSAGAAMDQFRNILTHAYQAGASGYLAGRAIWADAFRNYPDWDAIRDGLRRGAVPYMRDINALTEARATPWHAHPVFQGNPGLEVDDGGFRAKYPGMEG